MKTFTDIIAKYISNELSASDKATFEKELATNAELKKEYEQQLQIIEGIKRMGLKNQVSSSFKTVKIQKLIKKAAIGLVIALSIAGAVLLVKNATSKPVSQVLHELNEQGQKAWSEADRKLESQLFKLNPLRDTIIETGGGIVISVPAGSFTDKLGKVPAGTVDFEIKEALTASEIMRAGLSTMSDGRPLETGGMFYINARNGEENLNIDQSKPLNVNVPVNNNKKDMMLFKGERKADGSINWVDPKPLTKKLTTVDITKLNFYPEHFLDSVRVLGFNNKNKKLTDSIYYSFSGFCSVTVTVPTPTFQTAIETTTAFQPVRDTVTTVSNGMVNTQRPNVACSITSASSNTIKADSTKVAGSYSNCEIDPSRIKAIWDKKFNRTILATKEFEERLKVIFSTCNPAILDLYINNMDKNLYEIDSMAANLAFGETRKAFLNFYERYDGGISITDARSKELQDYFKEKKEIYNRAIAQTLQQMYQQESQANQTAFLKQLENMKDRALISGKTFSEELEINLEEAYRQLGKTRSRPSSTTTELSASNAVSFFPVAYYSAPVSQTGWCNVDRYTIEATMSRTTLNYSDNATGKRAAIRYQPVTVAVDNFKNYDRVVSYMIPDKLSSFQLMKNSGNGFKENLNELMNYSIVTIGFKGNDTYYNEIKGATAQPYTVSLKAIKSGELDQLLNSSFPLNQQQDLVKDIAYQLFETKDYVRKQKIQKREEVRNRLRPVVFPCLVGQQEPASPAFDRVYEH